MKTVKNITLFMSLLLPYLLSGQQYCSYELRAIDAYQANDFVLAKSYIDSALIICENKNTNSYYWHVKGFIEKDIYLKVDSSNINSPNRDLAIAAFIKSIELDTITKEFESANRKALAFLGSTYNNDAAGLMDTINFEQAMLFYSKYKNVYKVAKPSFNFKQKDLEYNNSLAHVLYLKYDNNPNKNVSYLNRAIASYNNSLAIDSLNYSANYNLGIMYHNLGVSVIKNMDDEISFEALISSQENAVSQFVRALPFLKRAYLLQPKVQNNLTALAAVYISLNDYESSNLYLEELNELKESDE